MPVHWLFLAACDRTPPATDGGFTKTFGDGSPPVDEPDTGEDDPGEDTGEEDTGEDTGTSGSCTTEEGLDCSACDQAGFWQPTRGLGGSALVEALRALTEAQDCRDYSEATEFMFVELDNQEGEVTCVYTGRTTPIVGGQKPDAIDMNTEHSWPQSQGAEQEPARCDLHHLYPTDSDTNNLRANHPFGEVVTETAPVSGGSRFGRDASGETVFEPRDAHKGNLSRSMLYFAMRYGHSLSAEELALYRSWSALDPVDPRELERTLRIAEVQGIENPYVVCPWLVDAL